VPDLLVRGERVVLPEGIQPATVRVRDGRIAGIGPYHDSPANVPELDAGSLVVFPGFVDTHVHINDPGREDWEGFEHATRAAAAGGITTLVDMPLNSIPPTTTVAALHAKRRAAAGRCHVDVGYWGGVVPGNAGELEALARAGVLGFKCFLCPSGVDEFAHIGAADLRQALPVLTKLHLPLLVHAELPSFIRDAAVTRDGARADVRSYRNWLDSRPPAAEHAAIDLLIALAREHHARVHVVHLASADALPAIERGRADGVDITVETCPHYLTFAAEDIDDGRTAFKCAPPIRDRNHRERLWKGLLDGGIDFIASDHSPAPAALKRIEDGDFVRAWGGIASLQIAPSIVWTSAAARAVRVERLATWMAKAPARLAGIGDTKGTIVKGRDADFVVWDPDAEFTVSAQTLYHRHRVTPYDGARLRGRVRTTILRGDVIVDDGACVGPALGRSI